MIEILADRGEVKNDSEALPPPPIFFSDVYLLINSNEFVRLNENELFFFYKRYYSKKFKFFKGFLTAVLNDGFIIDERLFKDNNYPKRFKLNPKIEKVYSDSGFNEFFKKYSKETASKRLALNRAAIKDDEYLTILYILFKNRYDISSDCYLGIDYIRKREDSFK
ncbi:hypothetical protein C8C82_2065 [Flavobacterium sp. 81]|uniref:hypothetical protein n=1 Tax=unclassified Flavobacterium TaxID=196869 RepID=UPI000F137AB2|nr:MULTISPECIES: hypothetical protein [unclassified Flavobacterium]RKR10094.1 hypothetical protein C8C82_2065 [Flavobacterium sp. 81]